MIKRLKAHATDVLLPIGAILVLFIVLGICFDFYYEFNDDVLIKDIISGRYTGRSDGHSVQILYLLGGPLAALYQVVPAVPWFALFMYACFGVGLYLIIRRSLSFCRTGRGKGILVLLEITLVAALMLWELVFLQYTVVCGFLVTTAVFLFYTTPNDLPVRMFLKKNVLSVVLVILAFFVRTEMTLLLSPFIAVAGIFHWSNEKQVFCKVSFQKYLAVVGAILTGCFIGMAGEKIAYASDDWKGFLDFFDARTQVYDYTWYPNYDNAKVFYEEAGISESQFQLIDTYNYSLDESINTELLREIAAYGEKQRNNGSLSERGIKAVRDLYFRTLHDQDAPYNYLVISGYVLVVILAFMTKDVSYIWKLPLMGVLRCVPWIYLLISDRVPQRIWHPLYWIELVLLLAVIIKQIHMWDGGSKSVKIACCTGVCAFLAAQTIVWLPDLCEKVKDEEIRREEINEPFVLFNEYAEANPGNYYFMDVYSSVNFSEKSFKNRITGQKNYDILGGWIAKSPLQEEALNNFFEKGESVDEILLQDNCYFVTNGNRDLDFLTDYYEEQGILLSTDIIHVLGEEDRQLLVLKIKGKSLLLSDGHDKME